MLSPSHGISIKIRHCPRQRRKVEGTDHSRREGPILPKRRETAFTAAFKVLPGESEDDFDALSWTTM